LWKIILAVKYSAISFHNCSISSFWCGVLTTKYFLDISVDKIVGNELTIQFWNDRWFHAISFSCEFPNLYSIATYPNLLVSSAFELGKLNL
jgi:hypothetical protein